VSYEEQNNVSLVYFRKKISSSISTARWIRLCWRLNSRSCLMSPGISILTSSSWEQIRLSVNIIGVLDIEENNVFEKKS